MGFAPDQVGRMSPWQFVACLDGYGRANGWTRKDSAGQPMSIERLRELGVE